MARGRKSGPSRLDLRKQAEAAEAREVTSEDEEEKDEEEEGDADADEEEAADDDGGDGDGDSDDDDKPKSKSKKKKEPAAKKPTVKRTRAVKEVRMRAIWVILDNGSKVIESFPYPQKAEAEDFLAKKIEEKKGTFYLQMRKEAID